MTVMVMVLHRHHATTGKTDTHARTFVVNDSSHGTSRALCEWLKDLRAITDVRNQRPAGGFHEKPTDTADPAGCFYPQRRTDYWVKQDEKPRVRFVCFRMLLREGGAGGNRRNIRKQNDTDPR